MVSRCNFVYFVTISVADKKQFGLRATDSDWCENNVSALWDTQIYWVKMYTTNLNVPGTTNQLCARDRRRDDVGKKFTQINYRCHQIKLLCTKSSFLKEHPYDRAYKRYIHAEDFMERFGFRNV
jgi:hypothetical protein